MNPGVPPDIDTSRPSIARIYDAMLGGKDHFEIDREARDTMVRAAPDTPRMLQNNRRWLQRAVRWLAGQAGIVQFLDVGSGLPTAENTHQVAQRANPDARVVYVENDPTAIAFGSALLHDDERTFFAAGDLTRPDELLSDPAVAGHLDLDRPVALLQCATLHFVPDQADAERIMAEYAERLASGSYVGITHGCRPEPGTPGADARNASQQSFKGFIPTFTPRSVDEIRALFAGLDILPPGVVPIEEWWPEGPTLGEPSPLVGLLAGGVAKKS